MIYFIQAQSDKRIKIGKADDPTARLRQLRTGSSSKEPYIILAVLPGGSKRETELKNMFKEFRSHGEWFEPAPELIDFINKQTNGRSGLKHCRVCGVMHLVAPEESDIRHHSKLHKSIRQGAYPYSIREFMKKAAWALLLSDKSVAKISLDSRYQKDDLKRVVVYSWWAREREAGLSDTEFEDFVLEYMDYIDARISGDKQELQNIEKKLKKHWGRV